MDQNMEKRTDNKSSGPVQLQQDNEVADDSQRTSAVISQTSEDLNRTICVMCNLNIPGEWVVKCDDCDRYFHFDCVGFIAANDGDPWSCIECMGGILSSTTTRQTDGNKNVTNQDRRVTVESETVNSNQLGRNTSTDFQARSLELRQHFERRFDDMMAAYQSSERRELNRPSIVNAPVSNRTAPTKFGSTRARSSQQTVEPFEISDSTRARSSQQVIDRTESSTQPVNTNNSNHRVSGRETTSSESTSTDYRSVSSRAEENNGSLKSYSKVPSMTSKVSKSSSQKLRDIELRRLQEEFELQTRIDDERLALERRALELKELRQKKLIEGKYRAMEEIVTVYSGSSVSAQSKLAENWILEQRKQNYRLKDVHPEVVSTTLGVDLSVPVNGRELHHLQRRQKVDGIHKHQSERSKFSDTTFTIEKPRQSSQPLTSVTPAYNWNQGYPPNHTYDGRSNTAETTKRMDSHHRSDKSSKSKDQKVSNNRISWDENNHRPNKQSTQIFSTTQQTYTNRDGESQNFTAYQSKQSADQMRHDSNGNDKQQKSREKLTPEQIASRHSMPKDLPFYYGHPEEWPSFIKRYHNTTNLCGYGDDENLERLFKCLQGKAYDLVESLLFMPECVDEIIETLRDKFGRPELIAQATLEKIRAEQPIKHDKLETLSDFGYKVRNACNVIESMGLHYYLYNPELIQDIVKKLPFQIKIEWARHADDVQGKNQQINLRTIAEWLHKLSRTLNQITTLDLDSLQRNRKSERKLNNVKSGYLNVHDATATTSEVQQEHPKCVFCSNSCSSVTKCSKFKSLNSDEKWKCVIDNGLCRKCLTKHGRKNCPETKFRACGVHGCELKHNSLLHNEERHAQYRTDKTNAGKQKTNSTNGKSYTNANQSPNPSSVTPKQSNTHQVNDEAELFRIVPVKLKNKSNTVQTFAFLDEGSSYTLMEKKTAVELNAEGTAETICLLWTNGIHRQEETSNVNLEISGVNDGDPTYPMKSVNVVDDLGLSPQSVDPEALAKRFTYLKGLPLPKYCNAIPTILIGMKHIRLSTPLDTIEGEENQPIASRSRLGWSVYGPTEGNRTFNYANHHKVSKCPCSERDNDLHNIVKEYFTIENFGVSVNSANLESKENQKAMEMLEKYTIRKGDRFETRLLWKNDAYLLPDSYGLARKRLVCLENKGEEVVKIINEIIEDYLAKGYASKLTRTDLETKHPRTFYLPIFTVTNPKKPEKIRPVFDAAATVSGVSLNSALLTGPDLLSPLVNILRRFREHQIAVVGDIKEMFHRIWINPIDRHSQRFLWRNGDRNREPDVYEFDVMTFGSKCSPSSAQFVKNKNASEYKIEYPRAATSIIDNHYVDDMLDGEESVEKAIKLINDVKFVHSRAGFEIRNFKSNSKEVLSAIGESTESSKVDLTEGNTTLERVLGMFWETTSDCFMFSLKYTKIKPEVLNGSVLPTKRQLLSLTMSLYDPLGLISYYVIHARCLLQELWRTDIGWDEKLPNHLAEKWKRWIELLPLVEQLKVPRWYSSKLITETTNELHIFVDAGDEAFAALAYLRISDDEGVECSLIGSKAKVTPLKYLSTTRKELMAAVLGARLINSVEDGLSLKIGRRVIWSDSNTVLAWLKSDHRRYSQFVAHRVGEISEITNLCEWRWVPSKMNVADEATKWSKKPTFDATDRWFIGPQFLQHPESEWPAPKEIKANSTTEEMRASFSHSKLIIPSIVDAAKFSTWQRLVRAVGNVKRISAFMVAKLRGMPLPSLKLSQEDLLDSERRLIRQAQWEDFTDEMVILKRNQQLTNPEINKPKPIDKGSSIVACSPYIDEFGIMRVKGRIDSATAVTEDAKRPIILPRDNAITKLIVLSYHTKFQHQNHETVINELRQKFYIPRIRTVLKSVRWSCRLCTLRRCKPENPQMADLPAIRFEAGIRPFTYTGVDYFGPMKVKVGRQTHKRWGVLYTCLTIRAVWIDVVPNLETEACILSVRDFVNRKGKVEKFFSDNATYFRGTDNELTREMQKIDFQRLSDEFTSCYTTWYFNPPESPHMGGMWERMVQSVKASLYESMITRTPTDQMLRSWLIEAENIVNSRPLTFVPLETEEDEALTPNHFILGSSNGMKPPGKFDADGPYLRQQWKEIQRCADKFWKRFIHEYVPTLVRKTKWFDQVKPLKVGDLVINFDEDAPRNTYKRARVVETVIGTNQQVRRAKVQFANGNILWRSTHHLGRLDVNTAPTDDSGLDHPMDDINGGKNVGAKISIDRSKIVESNVSRSVRAVRRK